MDSPVLTRRQLIARSLAAAAVTAQRSIAAAPELSPKVEDGIAWYDVRAWGVEGRGWTETTRFFDRLPAKAQASVPGPVWNLSRHSAGMLARFETNAAAVHARYSLLSASLSLPHMPATGVSGLDLYAQDERGSSRWLAVSFPNAQQMTVRLAQNIDPAPAGRLYTLYLPLYNGVESLEIGVDPGASFKAVTPRTEKPILFYGTSIMHGACASRPGMSITAIVGRRFGRPVINLGFSGNGRMDPEVVSLLAELDPCVYAIDCLPNMNAEQVAERTEPLVRRLRESRPRTPILLVEDRTFTNAVFIRATRERHEASRAALKQAYQKLIDAGVKGLTYLDGARLLGEDGEAATDGSHPNDLGMVRYADAYEKSLRRLL